MSLPLAYFLTWTCYGQRLHGDERGTVDHLHNAPGTPYLPPDPDAEELALARMSGQVFTLTRPMLPIAHEAMSGLCAERGWHRFALAVQSTHAHIVFDCRGRLSPERAMAQLKARATRDLRRAGLAGEDERVWTRHGSTRWINNEEGLIGAIVYVNEWQTGPVKKTIEERRELVREQIAAACESIKNAGN